MLDDLTAALHAEQVYASVDALALATHSQLAALASSTGFSPWTRNNPPIKPRLSGLLSTPQGTHRVTILLDTGATHCFICARLAAATAVGPARTTVGRHCGWTARTGNTGLDSP